MRPDSLDQARENLEQAQQDPAIANNAQVPLYEARQLYDRAEHAWDKDRDEKEVEHLAYLTNQKIEIAREMAKQKLAEAEAQRLAGERERVILEARTREADAARRLAEARAREAAAARSEAQARGQEAQAAREEAAVRAREAETARQESETRLRAIEEARQRAEDAAAQNKRLAEQLADLKARETDRGIEVTLSSVLFDFDKATLKPGAERSLSPLVDFLKSNPQRRITIEGHTDSVGADSYNRELSQQRADAVRNWFLQNGIGADRVMARGMGPEYPVASNDTVAGRQANRRVQIIIQSPEQSAARR